MQCLGIAIRWQGWPTLQRLDIVASAIIKVLGSHLQEGEPCVVIVDGDVVGLLGSVLDRRYQRERPVICLDGVHIHEFDHIDIGAFEPQYRALPAVRRAVARRPSNTPPGGQIPA